MSTNIVPQLTPSNKETFTPVPLAGAIRRKPDSRSEDSPFFHTPHSSTVTAPVLVNDDEVEKRQRRLHNNMCTMMSPGCHTPKGTSGSAHSDKSRSVEANASSLTNTQLAEHYANCIKLSSQNKISAKNAFGLHLIDHMLKLLKMRGEMSNFQIASSTLDAGAKIYAGRVDSIYNDAFKVLGGLGRQHHHVDKEGEEKEETEEGVEAKKQGRRRKKHRGGFGLMIEEDPKNLDLANFDLISSVDPLFQKTAAAFDEGGVEGLLLNNLTVRDDNCTLMLDASLKPVTVDEPIEGITVQLKEGLFDLATLQSRQICPTFANFKFNSGGAWNVDSLHNEEVGGAGRGGGVDQDADFTMLDCPSTAPDYGADDDDGFGGAPAMDADADQAFNTITRSEDITVLGVCSDNQVAQFVPAAGAESEKTSAPLPPGMGDLCLTDLIVPSDYSYFPPAVIASWAGPQHWKFRARNLTKNPEVKEVRGKKRKKSSSFKVDFAKVPKTSLFAIGKRSSQLSKAAIEKLDSSATTLPRDVHTDVDILHRLFSRPKLKVSRQKKETDVVDDGLEGGKICQTFALKLIFFSIYLTSGLVKVFCEKLQDDLFSKVKLLQNRVLYGDWYNYNNTNDQLNYCPPVDNGSDDYDDAMDEMCPGFYSEADATLLPTASQQNMEFEGENLMAHPYKVNKIEIDYARTSKKVDVKKLKDKMWTVISTPVEQTDSPGENGVSFGSLYSELPSMVTSGMSKNLSVPLCFVCLLHLANEKELKLESETDLSNVNIFTK